MTNLLITDLKRSQCRFPITPNEATTHYFCGESVESEGCPYCAKHAALCYDRRPAEVKRAYAERAQAARLAKKAIGSPFNSRPAVGPKF